MIRRGDSVEAHQVRDASPCRMHDLTGPRDSGIVRVPIGRRSAMSWMPSDLVENSFTKARSTTTSSTSTCKRECHH